MLFCLFQKHNPVRDNEATTGVIKSEIWPGKQVEYLAITYFRIKMQLCLEDRARLGLKATEEQKDVPKGLFTGEGSGVCVCGGKEREGERREEVGSPYPAPTWDQNMTYISWRVWKWWPTCTPVVQDAAKTHLVSQKEQESVGLLRDAGDLVTKDIWKHLRHSLETKLTDTTLEQYWFAIDLVHQSKRIACSIFYPVTREGSDSPEVCQEEGAECGTVTLPFACSSKHGCVYESCLTGGPLRFGAEKELNRGRSSRINPVKRIVIKFHTIDLLRDKKHNVTFYRILHTMLSPIPMCILYKLIISKQDTSARVDLLLSSNDRLNHGSLASTWGLSSNCRAFGLDAEGLSSLPCKWRCCTYLCIPICIHRVHSSCSKAHLQMHKQAVGLFRYECCAPSACFPLPHPSAHNGGHLQVKCGVEARVQRREAGEVANAAAVTEHPSSQSLVKGIVYFLNKISSSCSFDISLCLEHKAVFVHLGPLYKMSQVVIETKEAEALSNTEATHWPSQPWAKSITNTKDTVRLPKPHPQKPQQYLLEKPYVQIYLYLLKGKLAEFYWEKTLHHGSTFPALSPPTFSTDVHQLSGILILCGIPQTLNISFRRSLVVLLHARATSLFTWQTDSLNLAGQLPAAYVPVKGVVFMEPVFGKQQRELIHYFWCVTHTKKKINYTCTHVCTHAHAGDTAPHTYVHMQSALAAEDEVHSYSGCACTCHADQ
ncbi:hypothetical protein DV515_00000102 [Chloebia gouldiae]|uniref:Uncharacterized protein n=1 Tax=Chloebia gouldiae TaxID=44316 RepID=A0A3L8T0M1_CHLGU|nr:hypothetical protein DV515_00000102 [Chloebia gouldiae]